METISNPMIWGGVLFGVLFGVVLQRSGFCMLSAMSNLVLMHDVRHLHAWIAALAIAIPGTALLETYALVDIAATNYRSSDTQLFGPVIGGLMFGFGTVLAGGCASRTLIRSAEGDLGAWITLSTFAVAAIMTLYGLFAPMRGWLQDHTVVGPGLSLPELLSTDPLIFAVLFFALAVLFIIRTGKHGFDLRLLLGGFTLGILIVGAWWFTGSYAQDEFEPTSPQSLAVVGPVARTGVWFFTASVTATGFGIALIGGALLGASVSAIHGKTFSFRLPDQSRLPFLITGGLLMGIGAVAAGGCNIGQGVAGISTCSLNSVVAVLFMFLGMRGGLQLIFNQETFST